MDEFNDLTAEERGVLGGLSNPDSDYREKYKWDEELQREILSLLLNDRQFVVHSNGLIQPKYFTNEAHRLISKVLFSFFEKYKAQPNKNQLITELKELVSHKEPKSQVFFFSELNTVFEYYVPGLETRNYYLDKITNFAKGMAMKHAFSRCLEEYKKAPESENTWSAIETIVKEALAVDRNVDIGLNYFQDYEERYRRRQERIDKRDFFVTGFKDLDDALSGGGFVRGEIGSVMGLPGTGKSIFLVNAAIANIHRGKKVLYLTLEIDQDKCAERFDAQFANPEPFGEANTGVSVKNLSENQEKIFESLRTYVADKDDQRLLIVKQFPAGQMSMSDFRAYFSQLKMQGFKADLVIVDYVGEMEDYPGMPIHESRTKLVRDLRGMGTEEEFGVLTAMQPDGKSREAVQLGGVIDDQNLAEAKGQNRPLDMLWSINQLNEEKECGLARIFVIKHRDGKSRFTVYIQFDYNTLKMRQISKTRYDSILTKYKNERTKTIAEATGDEAKLDQIMNKGKKTNNFFNSSYGDAEDPKE